VAKAQCEPDLKQIANRREALAAIVDLGHHRWLWLKIADAKPNGDVTMPRRGADLEQTKPPPAFLERSFRIEPPCSVEYLS
jgi:hypothetical protein